MSGWIKIHRSIRKNIFFKNPEALALWIHLLVDANHEPSRIVHGNSIINLKPGQLLTSRKRMVEETGINRNKIERILKMFKSEQQIEQQSFVNFRMITITNWHKYQMSEQQSEQQVSSKRAASEHIKEDKECKEEKKEKIYKKKFPDFSRWPSSPDPEVFSGWREMRKAQKKPISQNVLDRVGKELQKAAQDGYSVNECLQEWETRNWKGFKAEYMVNMESIRKPKQETGEIKPYSDVTARNIETVRRMREKSQREENRT